MRATASLVLLPLTLLLSFKSSFAFHPIGSQSLFPSPFLAEKHSFGARSISSESTSKDPRRKLYSSANPGSSEIDDDPLNNKNKWQKNTVMVMRKIMTRFTAAWAFFCAVCARQKKEAKTMVASQLLLWTLLLGLGAKQVHTGFSGPPASHNNAPIEVPYSKFMDLCEAKNKNIGSVVIGSDSIGYRFSKAETEEQRAALENVKSGGKVKAGIPIQAAYTHKVDASPHLISYLRQNQIPFQAASRKATSATTMAVSSLILSFYAIIMIRMYLNMKGGGGSPGKLAKKSDLPLATFDDVEGIDNAKFEVMELVDALRNPGKYAMLGARAPTGLLLEGPPGTGKTMLARATAATAGVPLLYCSGSDFVEMFVGTRTKFCHCFWFSSFTVYLLIIFFIFDLLSYTHRSGCCPSPQDLCSCRQNGTLHHFH